MTNFEIISKTITERRSTKPQIFNGKKIDNAVIEQLLNLANWAPTHAFTEPWRFVVMHGDGVKRFCEDHANLYKQNTPEEKFIQATYDKLKTQGDSVSHIIAVFSKRGENPNIPELEEICATACAVQNILLGAESLDIAALWSTGGQILKPSMKQYLNLREEDTMLGILYLGYTDQPKPAGKRLVSMEEKVMWYRS
ncbi:nitroreductase [Arachidicoccus ginsenosidimutans]|uniref:nitroreductase family protein n=1 Tax=Arachidicoccus sp. BS20 TaxID=1850526 RepID=UPI0007F0823C|nr:nitroreductase [Arachidicoccus sp. BS20]ANI88559.1 nitroreductase [Arachidicoccus sp. BS20]